MGLFSTPKVKYAGEVDLNQGMSQTFALNQAHFDQAVSQTSRVNEAGQKQALDLLEQAMPGISRVRGLLMGQLQEELKTTGLPKEVEQNLARKAAEMGISRGTAGDFNKFSALRDLGIEHTKMVQFRKQMAMTTMQQLFQATPRVNPMSPMSLMLNPGQTIQTMSQNLDRRQAYYNAQAQAEAQNKANVLGAISSGLSLGMFAMGGGFKKPPSGEAGGGGSFPAVDSYGNLMPQSYLTK